MGADNKNGLGGFISNVSGGLLPSGGNGGREDGAKVLLREEWGGASTILCTQIITATLLLNIQFTKYIPVSLM